MIDRILIGDIGGTNVRLALCNIKNGEIHNICVVPNKNYSSLELLINDYLINNKIKINNACIAIACPIIKDIIKMTNHSWTFSINDMKNSLKLKHLKIINDYTAMSMAIPMLKKKDVVQFGGCNPILGQPIVVYGAGTGLGVSYLININNRWISLPSEGGHVDFASNNEEEDKILSLLRAEWGHVSVERILSGPGLVNIYQAISILNGSLPEKLLPKQVTERALNKSCGYSQHALSLFCTLMGRFGGNLALNMGTFGGVYITGGMIKHFLDFFCTSNFRYAFEDKGRFKNYLINIPVYLMNHQYPGLLGTSAYMRQLIGYVI